MIYLRVLPVLFPHNAVIKSLIHSLLPNSNFSFTVETSLASMKTTVGLVSGLETHSLLAAHYSIQVSPRDTQFLLTFIETDFSAVASSVQVLS